MAEGTSAEVNSHREMSVSRRSEDGKDMATSGTADVRDTAMKIERASEVYKGHTEVVDKPTKLEIYIWYFYEFCSYFIQTILVPVCFTLHLSEIEGLPPEPARGWNRSPKGLLCSTKEAKIYVSLTSRSIPVSNSKFSPLEWAAFSWGIGLFLAAPILGSMCIRLDLDRGRTPVIIAGASIVLGAIFCLPTGFFNVTWIFPPDIAFIILASTIASATHTRQLGLMIRGFAGPGLQKSQFHLRRATSSWLSLYSTAAGSLGAAIISAFIFHMLDYKEKTLSLWVVSIFSGIIWILGIAHVAFYKPAGANTNSTISSVAHFLSIFKYPHAYGNLMVAFLSSFTTMCIFTSVVLHVVGQLCLKPVFCLYLWLVYFIFPLVSLPLLHPLQQLIKSNGVKMYLLGFNLSAVTSGFGFYFRGKIWERKHILIFSGLQSTSVGLLHAFGRVLMLDCTPYGKEGSFSAWFSWVRTFGTCAGFAAASAIPENSSTSLAISFCTAIAGGLILIYSNISDSGGAVAAGNVIEYYGEGHGSPVRGLDSMVEPSREDMTS